MADAGVGETAAAEGSKSAGEAGAAKGAGEAASAGATDAALASAAPATTDLAGFTALDSAASAGAAGAGAAGTAGATGTLAAMPIIDSAAFANAPLDFSGLTATTAGAASAPAFLPEAASGATAADSLAAAPTFGQQLGTAAQYLGEANSAVNFAQNPNLQNAASLGLNTYGLSSGGTAGLSGDGTASNVTAPGVGAGGGGGAGLGSGGDGFQSVVPSTSDVASAAAQQTGSSAPSFLPDAAQAPLPTDSALNTVTPPPTPGFVDKALGALGNMSGHDWLNAGNLALGTTSLAMQAKNRSSAQSQLNAAAAPSQGVEKQLLNQFQTGQLTGADAQAIAQWTQQQTAQVNQYYQQAGLSNSSMHQAALTQVSQQADQMRQQALNNMLSNGLSAAGVANPLISAGVTAGVQQDGQTMQTMQNFLNTLARMNTQNASAPAPAPVPTGSGG